MMPNENEQPCKDDQLYKIGDFMVVSNIYHAFIMKIKTTIINHNHNRPYCRRLVYGKPTFNYQGIDIS